MLYTEHICSVCGLKILLLHTLCNNMYQSVPFSDERSQQFSREGHLTPSLDPIPFNTPKPQNEITSSVHPRHPRQKSWFRLCCYSFQSEIPPPGLYFAKCAVLGKIWNQMIWNRFFSELWFWFYIVFEIGEFWFRFQIIFRPILIDWNNTKTTNQFIHDRCDKIA